MKKTPILVLVFLLFTISPATAFEYYMWGLGGYGNYYYEGDTFDGAAAGISGGIQASDELSLEATVQWDEVDPDDYYFMTAGARYRFLKADFFMEPSVDIHGGILYPVGDKSDVDGVMGLGLALLYRTNYNIEFGPRVDSNIVFAGPHFGTMLSGTFFIGYRF